MKVVRIRFSSAIEFQGWAYSYAPNIKWTESAYTPGMGDKVEITYDSVLDKIRLRFAMEGVPTRLFYVPMSNVLHFELECPKDGDKRGTTNIKKASRKKPRA
jgi:hypothetical protein